MTTRGDSIARSRVDGPARVQFSALPADGGAGRPERRRRFRKRSARLSGKERRVLEEIARGGTTEEVAEVLVISPHTVRTHIKNGMRKLGARTRAHAVAIALSEGAIELER